MLYEIMLRPHLFIAAFFILLSAAAYAADEWASYATISAEPAADHFCTGDANGKDIVCASTAPTISSGSVAVTGNVSTLNSSTTQSDRALFSFKRSRGTESAPTGIFAGDYLGAIIAWAYTGSTFEPGASIEFMADGGASPGDIPGRIEFKTALDGTNARLTRLTIKNTGNVGVGTTTPDASALFDLASTTQGLLPPRMTTAERDAISAPAAGLTIYNTSANTPNVYTGSAWASYATLSAESAANRLCTTDASGTDILCAWPAPTIETNGNMSIQGASATQSSRPVISLQRSRGTVAVPTGIFAGDYMGAIYGEAYTGSAYEAGASIEFMADGSATAGDIPGRIELRTALDGTNTRLTRLTIKNTGNVGIGTSTPGEMLEVAGNVKIAGTIQTDNSSATCSVAADKGKFRYNSSTGKFQICR